MLDLRQRLSRIAVTRLEVSAYEDLLPYDWDPLSLGKCVSIVAAQEKLTNSLPHQQSKIATRKTLTSTSIAGVLLA